MNIQMIPLNKLIPSPANVRKTGSGSGIDELAASIKAVGLLQNLAVRPAAKGKYEVVAGGRRLAALKLLAKGKEIGPKTEIACNVFDGDATEISLAENVVRLPMHPADQYDAFRSLAESGKGHEEIAARFGTSPAIVRQRLKLASVSPRLIEAYRAEEMTLDHLMAFTVSDDHAAQEAAWFEQPSYRRNPSAIRASLTAGQVEANDPRALYAGLDAYKAAGGGVIQDLFDEEHEGYLTDPALLDRLVAEKLAWDAEAVRAEGWKWVEATPHLDYETRSSFGRLHPEQQPLPEDQQQRRDALATEYDALIEEHGDDPEPEIAAKLDELSEQIDQLSEAALVWRPEDIAIGGAIVSIAGNGTLEILRGLLRPEDRPKRGQADADSEGRAKPGAASGGLSARLVEDLTAHRTAALRVELSERSDIALPVLVHALALPLFYGAAYGTESCLAIRVASRPLDASAEGIEESDPGRKLTADHEHWTAKLPSEPAELLGWLLGQESGDLLKLLAYCAGLSIDAVRGKQDRPDCPRLANADRLAETLSLDMANYWQPTKRGYFGRVSKALALNAVREGASPQAAQNLESFKKDALADAAETRLAGSRWLPPVLRPAAVAQVDVDTSA